MLITTEEDDGYFLTRIFTEAHDDADDVCEISGQKVFKYIYEKFNDNSLQNN